VRLVIAIATQRSPLPRAGETGGRPGKGHRSGAFPSNDAVERRTTRALTPTPSRKRERGTRRARDGVVALVLGAWIALAGPVAAEERILSFHSDIAVGADAGMEVRETIRVHAEGNQIRHGIYRDFPTQYRDRFANRVHIDFKPESLTRDGKGEPFHTEGQANGVRVYFGASDTLLDPGDYTYVLHYRTTRQLGFFEGFDELYWNVTGNGWDFPISEAGAAVTLPGSVAPSQLKLEAYTGEQGAKGRDYAASADAPSHATFRTTRALAPREGLTIVVGFPKGLVVAPTATERARWFLADNGGVLVGGMGLLLIWAYYLIEWLRVGRDPKPGVIIPQYAAPEGCTPGMLRHVERMAYDDRCFAADLVDLAVRGRIEIRKDRGDYSLLRKSGGQRDTLPPPEAGLLQDLLGSRSTLELKQAEHTAISAAIKRHKDTLETTDVGRYFRTNAKLVIPGAIIALVALLAGLFARGAAPQLAGSGFMLVWLGGWSLGVSVLVVSVIRAWRSPPGITTYVSALFLTLFSLPFVAGEIVGIGMFAMFSGIGLTIVAVLLVATNFAFFHWLKAPTIEGRALLDRIAGLRLYLGVAERDTLAAQKAPPLTIDEFQRFLPYALALGVEKTWADKFAAAVGPAAAAAAAGAIGWYQGGSYAGVSDFTSGLGSSLSGAISSSSTAPGSSSGGGGGGSSGGGGGGGGGGGW
jgi:uncharacterized membrane protein YgcG